MTPTRASSAEHGFTLVEVMVAATLLVVGVLGALTMLDGANAATSRTKARDGATNLAREAIEAARAVPYPELVPSRIQDELASQPGLGDASSATGWNIVRRGITFTLVPSVCSVDDGMAADGYGNHGGGSYCADSSTQGTQDANPDDYKRVVIDVTWREGAQTRTARQQGVINNPGSAFAPAVKSLVSNPVGPTILSGSSVSFTATTSSRAEDLQWNIDGVVQGSVNPTTSARTTFQWTWPTPPSIVDGTYDIAAEAFDAFGQSGTGRSITLQLNRYAPTTPAGFVGGRNPLWSAQTPEFTEFEWNPNPERDIIGYRVKRVVGAAPSAADDVVCDTKVEGAAPTRCHTSAPAGTQHYYVVAYAPARGTSGVEESAPPSVSHTLEVGVATPPGPPLSVVGERNVDGTTIRWTAPADPDIRYYRIYRDDNTSFTKRLDRTGSGTDLAITDPNAVDTSHNYWITAVDGNLAESEMAPPGGISP